MSSPCFYYRCQPSLKIPFSCDTTAVELRGVCISLHLDYVVLFFVFGLVVFLPHLAACPPGTVFSTKPALRTPRTRPPEF